MKTEEIDKRIGMPDIDQEWAKFEKEVIVPRLQKGEGIRRDQQKGSTLHGLPLWGLGGFGKVAAVACLVFLLSGVAIASAVIAANRTAKFATLFAPDDAPIYDQVDEMPAYAEGTNAMWTFLIQNLRYPQVAQDYGVDGRVVVQFVVEKDGRCTQYKVLKEATNHQKPIKRNAPAEGDAKGRGYLTMEEFAEAQKACTDEALRVCRLMSGKWAPGTIKGKAVRSRFTIPVSFSLK